MQRSLAPLARNLHVLVHIMSRVGAGWGLGDANEESYARIQEALVDGGGVIVFGGQKNLDADQPAQKLLEEERLLLQVKTGALRS